MAGPLSRLPSRGIQLLNKAEPPRIPPVWENAGFDVQARFRQRKRKIDFPPTPGPSWDTEMGSMNWFYPWDYYHRAKKNAEARKTEADNARKGEPKAEQTKEETKTEPTNKE